MQDVGKLVVGPARQVPKNAACAGVYGVWSNDIGGIAPWTLENQQIARAEPHPAQGSDRLIGRHVTEDLTERGLVISGQASVRARGSGLPRFVPGSFPRRGHPEILPRLYSPQQPPSLATCARWHSPAAHLVPLYPAKGYRSGQRGEWRRVSPHWSPSRAAPPRRFARLAVPPKLAARPR